MATRFSGRSTTSAGPGFRSLSAKSLGRVGFSRMTMSTGPFQLEEGITCNSISPGCIEVGKKLPIYVKKRHIGNPEDIASLVIFLCSDKAKHINGSNIVIDGGFSHSF